MSCFVLVGFAFGVHHPEALICGYVVATLFAMISFVPQGVGVVEAAVTVAFALFGIDSATGLAVVIVYRGIVFWRRSSWARWSSSASRRLCRWESAI